MTGWIPNAPLGVLPSPSRLCSEMPRYPSHAVHGPPVCTQQSPRFSQTRTAPVVDHGFRDATVTSCSAEPVEASWFARVGGHDGGAESIGVAVAAATSARQRRSASFVFIRAFRLVSKDDGVRAPRSRGGD